MENEVVNVLTVYYLTKAKLPLDIIFYILRFIRSKNLRPALIMPDDALFNHYIPDKRDSMYNPYSKGDNKRLYLIDDEWLKLYCSSNDLLREDVIPRNVTECGSYFNILSIEDIKYAFGQHDGCASLLQFRFRRNRTCRPLSKFQKGRSSTCVFFAPKSACPNPKTYELVFFKYDQDNGHTQFLKSAWMNLDSAEPFQMIEAELRTMIQVPNKKLYYYEFVRFDEMRIDRIKELEPLRRQEIVSGDIILVSTNSELSPYKKPPPKPIPIARPLYYYGK